MFLKPICLQNTLLAQARSVNNSLASRMGTSVCLEVKWFLLWVVVGCHLQVTVTMPERNLNLLSDQVCITRFFTDKWNCRKEKQPRGNSRANSMLKSKCLFLIDMTSHYFSSLGKVESAFSHSAFISHK